MATNTALAAYKAGLRARSKGKSHRKKLTIPLAPIAGFVPLTLTAVTTYQSYGPSAALNEVSSALTGYNRNDGKWFFSRMLKGWTPIIAGFTVHAIASRLGFNRMLGRMGVPFIRI